MKKSQVVEISVCQICGRDQESIPENTRKIKRVCNSSEPCTVCKEIMAQKIIVVGALDYRRAYEKYLCKKCGYKTFITTVKVKDKKTGELKQFQPICDNCGSDSMKKIVKGLCYGENGNPFRSGHVLELPDDVFTKVMKEVNISDNTIIAAIKSRIMFLSVEVCRMIINLFKNIGEENG